jgi:hypothetical protein
MNYTKPEVAVLGKAVSVIEHINVKGTLQPPDGTRQLVSPAYDLDE